jgi:hypothetical protein
MRDHDIVVAALLSGSAECVRDIRASIQEEHRRIRNRLVHPGGTRAHAIHETGGATTYVMVPLQGEKGNKNDR